MIENMNGLSVASVPVPIQRGSIGNAGRVRAYIQAYGLETAVDITVSLARAELPSGSETVLSLSKDGESEETWLVVHLAVNAPRDQIFDIFNRFGEVWIDFVPTAAQHRIHITYSSKQQVGSRMDEKKIDQVKFLAIWLHEAAQKAGQLDSVRKLIRSAFEDSVDMYGAPSEEEFLEPPEIIPSIISRFSSEWAAYEERLREDAKGDLPNPNPTS